MFDNILNQSATTLLSQDIINSRLPNSILFSGPQGSGKFSCALETARILSCHNRGEWNCTCSSCLRHKAMVSHNVLVVGSGNRNLEIAAAKDTLLKQNIKNSRHLEASRYLYLRAVRKLTARFSPVLWEGEDKLSKFSPVLESINDSLELIQVGRTLPDHEELKKILDDIEKNCEKLEFTFLYDSIPVSQIRNFSSWAHLSSQDKKKILIIENADLMSESARNALLKILEEPPQDVVFILTTTRRSSMLPTILSRVRTYNFFERTVEQQQNVISRIFHYDGGLGMSVMPESIIDFMNGYLPVDPEVIKSYSKMFIETIADGKVPDIPSIISSCQKFEPRVLLKIFFEGIIECQKPLLSSAQGCESSAMIVDELRRAYSNATLYFQNPTSVLEDLTRSLMQVSFINKGSLRCLCNE